MAVNKAINANPIVNGGSTVLSAGVGVNYNPSDRVRISETGNLAFTNANGRQASGAWREESGVLPISSADLHEPAANTAAVVTYAAETGRCHVIFGVSWSYSGTPTSGNLKIESPSGTKLFSEDITVGGPGQFDFPEGIKGAYSGALIVTLAAGGSGVSGKVSVNSRRVE